MTHTHESHLTLPIVDPDATLGEIRTEARDTLTTELERAGFAPVGNMTYNIEHGEHPTVTVKVMARPVVDAAGVSMRLVAL